MMYEEYLLRLTIIWAVLLAYYAFALRGAPLPFRRAYLLLTAVIGLLVPLLPAISSSEGLSILEPVRATFTAVLDLRAAPNLPDQSPPLPILTMLYVAGAGYFFARSLVQGYRMRQWTESGINSRYQTYPLTTHRNITGPFTAYGRIFLPEALVGTPIGNTALLHEASHLRQRHHLDTLLLQLLCTLLWFHPLSWAIRRLLSDVHEYQADAEVVRTIPKKTYGLQLLQASQTPFGALGLFSSPIRNRISMLTSTPRRQTGFTLAILPLLLISALTVTCSDLLAQEPSATPVHISAAGVPHLSTLPDDATNEEAMKAFLEEVYGEIRYPAPARNAGVEAVIYLSITVDPDGKSHRYEVTQRSNAPTLGGENIVIIGYATDDATAGGTAKDLIDEVSRMVQHLNKIGFKYEDSGYEGVPVTYGLSFRFKLEK